MAVHAAAVAQPHLHAPAKLTGGPAALPPPQASCALELQDMPSSVAILSRCAPDEANGNLTLATYRWEAGSRRALT